TSQARQAALTWARVISTCLISSRGWNSNWCLTVSQQQFALEGSGLRTALCLFRYLLMSAKPLLLGRVTAWLELDVTIPQKAVTSSDGVRKSLTSKRFIGFIIGACSRTR